MRGGGASEARKGRGGGVCGLIPYHIRSKIRKGWGDGRNKANCCNENKCLLCASNLKELNIID